MRKNIIMFSVFSLLITMLLAYGVSAEMQSGTCGGGYDEDEGNGIK